MKGILGKKLGMTQYFTPAGEAMAVTVIAAGPCTVVQTKHREKDGYEAIQIGWETVSEHRVNRPLRGHFARAGLKPLRYLREFRVSDASAYSVGQEIKVDVFSPGDKVDVTGISKGKGFAGGIKRYGFHRGPMAHGSKYHRRPGSLGAKGPARVFKGRKLPGHLGHERVTVQNLEVVKVDLERNLLVVKGAVPGPRGSLLIIKQSVKATR
ncbi:50S ribosomal protein L3 [Desulfothermobacter acidiphilus]|uniref:50S ribosomal protein L3 n=1 Tax=Desulfothermobacter acidiphilus TaxID=1938353 RepID=UPI003F8B4F6D